MKNCKHVCAGSVCSLVGRGWEREVEREREGEGERERSLIEEG